MSYTKYHDPWVNADAATGGGDESTPLVAAALDHIEAGIAAAIPDPGSATTAHALLWDGSSWVADTITDARIAADAGIQASKLAGYPDDSSVALLGDGSWGSVASVPTGAISLYGGSSAPTGWLLCDGSAVSRTTYAALFALISTAYGAGDGSTTFNLPDLRGRTPVGKGTHTDVDALGDNDGAALADRRPKHKHTVADPGHTHSVTTTSPAGGAARFATGDSSNQATPSVNSAFTGIGVGPQAAGTPLDTPAYLVVNYIIKT